MVHHEVFADFCVLTVPGPSGAAIVAIWPF
jgi:hypothetical protein